MKRRKGFTLVELLVTIAIILVLSTVAIVAYSSSIKKARLSNDESLVKVLNDYVQAFDVDEPARTTSEVRDILFEEGIKLETLKTESKDYRFGFDIIEKSFCLIDNKWNTNYQGDKANVYAFVQNQDELDKAKENGYSAYMQSDFFGDDKYDVVFTTDMAVDTGVNEIKEFYYINTDQQHKQNVILAVCAQYLYIDAPYDTITHYGVIKTSLDIERVANDSYIEYGEILGNVFIEKGHFIVADQSKTMYIIVHGDDVILDGITDNNFVVVYGGYSVLINSSDKLTTRYNYKDGANGLSGSNIIYMMNGDQPVEYNSDDPIIIMAHKFAGLGTKEHPFLLSNAEDYIRLQDTFKEYYDVEFPEMYFKQTQDIVVKQKLDINPENKIHIDTDGHTLTVHDNDTEFGENVVFNEDEEGKDNRDKIIDSDEPTEDPDKPECEHNFVFYDIRRHKCSKCGVYNYHKIDGTCSCGLISIKSLDLINKSGTSNKKVIYRLTKDHTLDDTTINNNFIDLYLSSKDIKLNKTLNITGHDITVYGDQSTFELTDPSKKVALEISGKNVKLIDVVIKDGIKIKKGSSVVIDGNSEVLGDLIVEEGGELIIKNGKFKDDPFNYLDDQKKKNAKQTGPNQWEVVDSKNYIYPVLVKSTGLKADKQYRSVAEAFASGATKLILQDIGYYQGIIDDAVEFDYSYDKINSIKDYPTSVIKLVVHTTGSIIKNGVYNVKVECLNDAKIDCSMTTPIYFSYSDNSSTDLYNCLADKNNYHVSQTTYNSKNYFTVCHKAVTVSYGTYSNSYNTFNEAYQDAVSNAGKNAVTITLYHDVTFAGNIDKNYTVKAYQDKKYKLEITYGTNVVSAGTYEVEVVNRENAKFITGGTYKYNPSLGVDLSVYYFSTTNPWTVTHGVASHNNVAYASFEEAYEASKNSLSKNIKLLENATYSKSKFSYDAIVDGNYSLTFTNAKTVISRGTFNVEVKTNDSDVMFLAGGKYLASKNNYSITNVLGDCQLVREGSYIVIKNVLLQNTYLNFFTCKPDDHLYNSFEDAYKDADCKYKYIVCLYDIPCNISITKDVVVKGNVYLGDGKYDLELQGANTTITNGLFIIHLISDENIKPIKFGRFYYDPRQFVADGFKAEQPCWLQYVNSTKGWSVGNADFVLRYDDQVKGFDSFKEAYDAVEADSTGSMIIINRDVNVSFDLTKDITYVSGGGSNCKDIFDIGLYVGDGRTISNGTFDIYTNIKNVNITHGLFNHYYNSEYFDKQISSGSAYKIDRVENDLYYNVRSAVARVNGKGYLSFDEAYQAASNGDTIELLSNCIDENKLHGSFTKNLTIKGSSFYLEVEDEITNGVFDCGVACSDDKISGGRFLYSIDLSDCKAGYATRIACDGYCEVGAIVAYIGQTPYINIDDAISVAIGNKDTINLVKNATATSKITKNIVFTSSNNSQLTVSKLVSKGTFNVKVSFASGYEISGDNSDTPVKFNKNNNDSTTLNNAISSLFAIKTNGNYYEIVCAKVSKGNNGYLSFDEAYNSQGSDEIIIRASISTNIKVNKNISVSIDEGKTLTINGASNGTFKGKGNIVSNSDITGGKFNCNVSSYLGYGYYQNDDGEVKLGKAVLNGVVYTSLGDAISNAKDGDTIDMLQSAKNDADITKNIHFISSNGNGVVCAKYPIKASTFDCKVEIDTGSDHNPVICAGKFLVSTNKNANWQDYIDAKSCYSQESNYYVVNKAVASLNGVNYPTLLSAYNKANDGETIKVIDDATVDFVIDRFVGFDSSYKYYSDADIFKLNEKTGYYVLTFTKDITNGVFNSEYKFNGNIKISNAAFRSAIDSSLIVEGYCCQNRDGIYYIDKHDYSNVSFAAVQSCISDEITRHTCKYCGKYYDEKTKDKVGHNYVFDHFEFSASYGSAKAVYVCTNGCKDTKEYTAAVVHKTVAATCTQDGLATHTASYDGHSEVKSETLPALGHAWGEFVIESAVITKETCTNEGLYHESCSRCKANRPAETYSTLEHIIGKKDDEHTFTVAKKAHVYDQKGNLDLVSAADCKNAAVYRYNCSCGATSSSAATYTYGQAQGHSYTEQSKSYPVSNGAATCQHGTYYYHTCTGCHQCGTTTWEDNDKLAHVYDQKGNIDKVSDQTCASGAVYRYNCSCGATSNDAATYVDGAGHGHHDFVFTDDKKYAVIINGEQLYKKGLIKKYAYYSHCEVCGAISDQYKFKALIGWEDK